MQYLLNILNTASSIFIWVLGHSIHSLADCLERDYLSRCVGGDLNTASDLPGRDASLHLSFMTMHYRKHDFVTRLGRIQMHGILWPEKTSPTTCAWTEKVWLI